MKRLYVGCLLFEANTSSPLRTDLEAFQNTYLAEGEETRGLIGANVEVGGFYSAMDRHEGISVVPGFVTWGVPGGKVTDETFRALAHRLYAGIRVAESSTESTSRSTAPWSPMAKMIAKASFYKMCAPSSATR